MFIILREKHLRKEYDRLKFYFTYDKKNSTLPYKKESESNGEKVIREFLIKNNIRYLAQYRFSDCKYVKSLAFDFAIFFNKELFCLIEFDGQQHFKPVNLFGGEDTYDKQKIKDEIKNSYCQDQQIKLIRIPYFEQKSIEDILLEQVVNPIRLLNTR